MTTRSLGTRNCGRVRNIRWTPYPIDSNDALPVPSMPATSTEMEISTFWAASTLDNTLAWYANADGQGTFIEEHIVTSAADLASDIVGGRHGWGQRPGYRCASAGDNTVAWWENSGGDGLSWEGHVITSEAVSALSVFVADVDGDGWPDVLSTSLDDDTVARAGKRGMDRDHSGRPKSSLSRPTGLVRSTPSTWTETVIAMCLSASEKDNTIAWYENDGRGGFGARQVIECNARGAVSVYAADIDEDGRMDVLSASTMDNTIAWYRSVPAGDSQPPHGIIEPVTPDPRIGAVNQVTITFDERVTGFDLSDIRLQRDGRFLSLANLASLETDDGMILVAARPGKPQRPPRGLPTEHRG